MISLCYVPQMTIEQFILYAAPYQIALNVDCWHIGQMATRSTSQIYERWCSVGFYGICKLMNMNLRVPIMISRLNSALFAAQIFHPLRRKSLLWTLSTEKSPEFGQNPNGERFKKSSPIYQYSLKLHNDNVPDTL